MKNAKYAIVALVCVALICVGFYFFAESQTPDETKLTDIEKVIVKDLEKDYPKTPREVVKFYNRIYKGYYGEEASDDQIKKMSDQMLLLLDEELLEQNPKTQYYQQVMADVRAYRQEKKVLLKTDVADSNEVRYIDDEKAGSTEADKLAYVKASYFVRTDKNFSNTYQEFVLRQDASGKWKIVAFYEIEGESSDDE